MTKKSKRQLIRKTGDERADIYLGQERRPNGTVVVTYTRDFANQGMRLPTGNRQTARIQRQEAARAAR